MDSNKAATANENVFVSNTLAKMRYHFLALTLHKGIAQYRLGLVIIYCHCTAICVEKAAYDCLKLVKLVAPVYHTFYSSRCIHEVDERKTDETVRLTRVVSSFLASR